MVTVRVPTPLRFRCGGASELAVDSGTVGSCLAELELRFPELHRSVCDETGALRRHVNVFVNRSNVRDRAGLATPVAPGDELYILPAVSGG